MKPNKTKYLSILLVILSFCVMLSACAQPAEPPAESQEEDEISDLSEEAEEGEAHFPVTVQDHLGREVTIESQPERIVSGYYITTSLLLALDLEENLVGIEAKAERCPIYGLAAPALLEMPNVGSAKEFNLEGCVALEPDLVILPVKLEDSIAALEDLGITVIGVEPESEQLLEEAIAMIGQATGKQGQAEQLSAYRAEKIANLSAALEEAEYPSVYFGGNSAFLQTAGANMYQHNMLVAGGGENVAKDLEDAYWAKVSYEQILAWNPEIIIIAPGAEYSVQDVLDDPALASVQAVSEGKVYAMPNTVELWDAPVPSSVLGSLWVGQLLHEDLYSTEQFQQDASAYYSEFYDLDVADLLAA